MPEKAVQVFHHNDSDGITSGAILTCAFERQGFAVRRFCLEKPYPAVLAKVYEQADKILVFADFAGRIAPLLSELNQGRNLTLILDHHVAAASTDPRVINLDPDLFGLKGDRDISGSTTCYLFARTLDPANRDLAHIAAVGAVGDGFFVDGALVSENRDVALEAARQGLIEIRQQGTGEQYLLNNPTRPAARHRSRRLPRRPGRRRLLPRRSRPGSQGMSRGRVTRVGSGRRGVRGRQDEALRRRDRQAADRRHDAGAPHTVVSR